jgi:acid phosphatase class B
MPTKFRPSSKTFVKGKSSTSVLEHSYIKNISKEELIKYINNENSKPKIKQKARNELQRRGIKLVFKTKPEV